MGIVDTKTIRTSLITMAVLLMWQTHRFILTMSPPEDADLQTLPNKNTSHFVNQSIKITLHVVHSQSELKDEKQKSNVYFVARGRTQALLGYFAIRTVVYPALSTYNTEFVALAVGTMNWLSRNSCCASSRRLGSQHCCFGRGRNLVGDTRTYPRLFQTGGI